MIRMIQSSSANHAKAYFSDALSKSDYYVSDQELGGYWEGKLADRLGIKGATSKEDFFAMCENRHPETGEHLTLRTKEERTTGYDINFHCPKSVSVMHILSKDDHILRAFQDSVSETMNAIEKDSKTRVRKSGQYDDRETGELAWAHFVHQTARPVEGYSPDPHLHSHCFVFNATWDETEQQMKASQFRDIKRDMPYYQACFHKSLSDNLMAAGYQIKRTDKSFEIEGVPQKVIYLFSKRTDAIGRMAKEKGITDAKELSELGARTRAKKQKGTSMEELKQEWKNQINAIKESGDSEGEKIVRFAPVKEKNGATSKECLEHAMQHCFERASVMADRRVLEAAYRHSIGFNDASIGEITQQFKNDDRIIHVRENARMLCTTREVLSEEKRMVDLARAGQGKMIPLYSNEPDVKLKGQQGNAIKSVLTSSDRVSIIRGAAGTGKTTLMRELVEHIEKVGKQVTVVAPTAQASRGVLKEEGFQNANTVARLLIDKEMQQKLQSQVLYVDEAGLLGTKDMTSLLKLATENNARLILGGDTRQHASVVRGDALRILNKVANIRTAEVSKNYRQLKEQYREAVDDLSNGDVPKAFQKLDAMGCIQNIDISKPNKKLVDDYVETIRKGKSAVVISPTHAQGENVIQDIRTQLKEEGLIGKREVSTMQLSNLNFTEAEKKDVRNIQVGHILQFNQNTKGIKRGSAWTVESSDNKELHLTNTKGEKRIIPNDKNLNFDVYQQREINLSKGDLMRITRGSFDENKKRLENGTILKVDSVSKKGGIVLRNEKSKSTYKLNNNFGHIAHAHCITSYAAQGKTVDEVFISQPASTFAATDAKQFYVSVSRGREQCRIYTDDKEALLHHASELSDRQSAIELVSNEKKDFLISRSRQEKYFELTKEKGINSKSKQREDYEPEI